MTLHVKGKRSPADVLRWAIGSHIASGGFPTGGVLLILDPLHIPPGPKLQADHSALPSVRLGGHGPIPRFHQLSNDGEAESGAGRTGTELRLENPSHEVDRYAGAVIPDPNLDPGWH